MTFSNTALSSSPLLPVRSLIERTHVKEMEKGKKKGEEKEEEKGEEKEEEEKGEEEKGEEEKGEEEMEEEGGVGGGWMVI
jgi:hypothetical protein